MDWNKSVGKWRNKVFIRNKNSESKERMKKKRNIKILINTDVRTMVDDAQHLIVKEKISGEKYKGKTRENEVVNLYIRMDWKRYLKKIKKI